MKTRNAILLLSLLLASCTTKNENSALVITKIIPATASVNGTSVSCVFDPAAQEFTPALPFNPVENRGFVAAVTTNNLPSTVTLNALLRTDSTTFLPHQAVVSYEAVGSGPFGPVQNIVPTSGIEVPGAGGSGTVGLSIFNGVDLTPLADGVYLRTTLHLEGKLLDGSTVHTAEREYLFQICKTAGCGLGGYYSTSVTVGTTTTRVTCL